VRSPSTDISHSHSLDLRQVPLVRGRLGFDAIMGVVALLTHLSRHHRVFLCSKSYWIIFLLLTKSLSWDHAG